jgi:hypothetical protein
MPVLSKTSEYLTWLNMKRRCHETHNPAYPRYGGRGIAVCDRWRHSFVAFLGDMGPKPGPRHSIERIDNDRGYEPGNCRWATPLEQSRNKRNSRLITAFGETKTLSEWADDPRARAVYGVIEVRIRKFSWDAETAISTPSAPFTFHEAVSAFDETKPLMEWSRDPRCRVTYCTLYRRILKHGWDAETAITRPPRVKSRTT